MSTNGENRSEKRSSQGKASSSHNTENEDVPIGSPTAHLSETQVQRLPSHAAPKKSAKSHAPTHKSLGVDPGLVVHRFSQRTGKDSSAYYQSDGRTSYYTEGESQGGTDLYGEDFWKDNSSKGEEQKNLDDFFESYYGQEEDLEDLDTWNENEDTIRRTTDPTGISEGDDTEQEKRKKRREKGEFGKDRFRWFERKILSEQIPKMSENERRKILLEKCQILRKVSKPIVTIFGGHGEKGLTTTACVKLFNPPPLKTRSEKDFQDGIMQEGGDDESAAGEDDTMVHVSVPEFSEKAWAMKDTIDFLTTAGCSASETPSYTTRLKSAKEEAADFRLILYERQLRRRREAIGHHMQAPEITAALRRAAERAIWRAVIDNTKPRYPLPRFILPRHQYLRKVQEQLIGPGSYEHDVYEKQTKARQRRLPSTWGNCSSRFPKEPSSSSTGATQLLDPWSTLDKANYKKRYPGVYVPFESTPKNYQGVALTDGPSSRIPPNAYSLKSPLEEFIKKKTSLRGPYDCYTPSRSVIPYGYFISTPDECRLGPGSYEIRSSLVKEMNDSYNFFKGQVGKADRYSIFGFKAAFDKPLWPRKGVMIPPPGHYEVGKDVIGSDKKQNKAPFRTTLKAKDLKRSELTAPDYYYFAGGATWTKPPKGANLASVFHSNTPQIMSQKMNLVRKTRNKSLNRNLDLGGYEKDVHYVPEEQFKKDYVLEDCANPCWKEKSGAVKDYYAIPGYGLASTEQARKSCGGCCG